MRPRLGWFFCLAIAPFSVGEEPPSSNPAQTPPGQASRDGAAEPETPGVSDLYNTGKELFDALAPPEIKQQYEFPSPDQFNAFMAKLQQTMDNGSLEELAAYEPQARMALTWLRTQPSFSDYSEWLGARIAEINEAGQITAAEKKVPPATAPGIGPRPGRGGGAPEQSAAARIPNYAPWHERLRGRPLPTKAASLMPVLRSAFADEGTPPELAWLAEVESSFNPHRAESGGSGGPLSTQAWHRPRLGLEQAFFAS